MDTENMKTLVEQNGSQSCAVLGELVDDELLQQNGNQAAVGLGELADNDLLIENGSQAAAGFAEVYDDVVEGKTVTGIDATFTQGAVVIYPTTPLNNLKQYLVVKAIYDDESEKTLSANEYTLSGTLNVGTSEITVSYTKGEDTFTDTFNVTVVAEPVVPKDYYVGYFNGTTPEFQGLSDENLIEAADSGHNVANNPTYRHTLDQKIVFALLGQSVSIANSTLTNAGTTIPLQFDFDMSDPHTAVTINEMSYTVVAHRFPSPNIGSDLIDLTLSKS